MTIDPPEPEPVQGTASRFGPDDSETVARLYIACPLTELDESRREVMSHRIGTLKQAVADTTVNYRTETDRWPVAMHIPMDHTAPWRDDGLSPATIYERNLDELLNADGLIVVADQTMSAGIGQEIEWAAKCGIPVLLLSRSEPSRQIRGIPHAIDPRLFGDAETLAAHVRTWLTKHRTQIQNGPRKRADREFAYLKLAAQLEAAWTTTHNPSGVAAQLGLHPSAVDSMIKSAARVAITPWWTICELATELGVDLDARRALTFPESRAWVQAAEAGTWDQQTAARLRSYATSMGIGDLERPATWTALHGKLFEEEGEN